VASNISVFTFVQEPELEAFLPHFFVCWSDNRFNF